MLLPQKIQVFIKLILHISCCIMEILFILLKKKLYLYLGLHRLIDSSQVKTQNFYFCKHHKTYGLGMILPGFHDRRQMFLLEKECRSFKVRKGGLPSKSSCDQDIIVKVAKDDEGRSICKKFSDTQVNKSKRNYKYISGYENILSIRLICIL